MTFTKKGTESLYNARAELDLSGLPENLVDQIDGMSESELSEYVSKLISHDLSGRSPQGQPG
jgi:hypothetical protein